MSRALQTYTSPSCRGPLKTERLTPVENPSTTWWNASLLTSTAGDASLPAIGDFHREFRLPKPTGLARRWQSV
jgi:hypothetical protein